MLAFILFIQTYNSLLQRIFSKQFFIMKIHELLLNAGIFTVGYSGHSLRKGKAVIADCNGISKDNIKLLGRWKSDAVDIYMNYKNART